MNNVDITTCSCGGQLATYRTTDGKITQVDHRFMGQEKSFIVRNIEHYNSAYFNWLLVLHGRQLKYG
jgi:hypothetical protein